MSFGPVRISQQCNLSGYGFEDAEAETVFMPALGLAERKKPPSAKGQ